MALSFTSRLHLPFWSAGTDVPTRDEINDAFGQLESSVPVVAVGTEGARGAADSTAGKQFYYATDTGRMWFMDGSAWQSVGRVTKGTVVGQANLTTDMLLDLRNLAGTSVLSIDAEGGLSVVVNESATVLSLPSGSTPKGGSWAVPAYYRTSEGVIIMEGVINSGGSATIHVQVPRPRNLHDHDWLLRSGATQADAFLNGATGDLTLNNISSSQVFLDGIVYVAER